MLKQIIICHCGHANYKHDLYKKCIGNSRFPSIREKCGCHVFHDVDMVVEGCWACGLLLERRS